jgi:hypothetical protein
MLLAIAAEFRTVDVAAASDELDELARGVFDADRAAGEASHRLAALLTDELRLLTDESSVAGMGEPDRLWLIDPALDPGPTPSGPVRSHCGHEVGFAALTGVYARMLRDGEGARACHAARLRGRLPVGRHV